MLAAPIRELPAYRRRAGPALMTKSHVQLLMFTRLMLETGLMPQKWLDLSYSRPKEGLQDRINFRRFVGRSPRIA
jgi:hypothetical protein